MEQEPLSFQAIRLATWPGLHLATPAIPPLPEFLPQHFCNNGLLPQAFCVSGEDISLLHILLSS